MCSGSLGPHLRGLACALDLSVRIRSPHCSGFLRQRSLAASGLEVRRPPALVLRTTDALEFDLIAMTFIMERGLTAGLLAC